MAEITNPFDPKTDYFGSLTSHEKYTDKKTQREYPLLAGLLRLAHTHRGGVVSVSSKIIKTPSVNSITTLEVVGKDGELTERVQAPDLIAAVTVSYEFADGTKFEGSADASWKAHEAPFNLHLTAVAESKAEARAIRRAFLITKVAKEEMGSDDASLEDDGPCPSYLTEQLKKLMKRKNLTQEAIFKSAKIVGVENINDLTAIQGREAFKAANRLKAIVEDTK